MKKLGTIIIILIFLVSMACTHDEFVTRSKLISAHHKSNSAFMSDEEFWVLTFENGMVVKAGVFPLRLNPKSFQTGVLHDIYITRGVDGGRYKVRRTKNQHALTERKK